MARAQLGTLAQGKHTYMCRGKMYSLVQGISVTKTKPDNPRLGGSAVGLLYRTWVPSYFYMKIAGDVSDGRDGLTSQTPSEVTATGGVSGARRSKSNIASARK